MNYTYILKSKKDSQLYLGSTTDLRKRFKEHNDGKVFSTKSRKPFELVYYEAYKKCAHCGDEIFWNTHKKLTCCTCKKIWVDGCEDYIRVGGNEGDYEVITK